MAEWPIHRQKLRMAFCYVCREFSVMAKKHQNQAKPTKKPLPTWVYPLLLIFTFIVVYPLIFDEKVSLGGDNASYYILGKALSSGEGYTNIHVPGNPAHNHFPPGYPIILAVFMFFTNSIVFLKWINGLLLLGTSLLSYRLFLRFAENKALAFVGALLILFNFHLLSYGTIMMSEVPFLFFGTLAMLLFVNMQQAEKEWYKNPSFYFLILVSSFAYHIRTAGIALVAGFALYMLLNKNWKALIAYLLGFVALGIPWFLRGQSLGGSSYLTQLFLKNPYREELGAMELSDWFTRFGNNLARYLGKEIPNGLFPGIEADYTPDASGVVLYGILIMAVVIFGLVKLPNYRLLITGYLLGTFGILLLWPDVWFGIRFMLPLIPLLLFLFLFGLQSLFNWAFMRASLKIAFNPLLFLVFVLAFTPQVKLLVDASEAPYLDKFKNYFEIAAWANKNTPSDAIICTRKPGLFYLFAGRQVAQFENTPDYNEFFAALDSTGFTHVVIDQLGYAQTGRFLVPAIQDNPEKFQIIKQTMAPETYLLSYNNTFGYSGEWTVTEKDGYYTHVRNGSGTLKNTDGSIYTGSFNNNLPNGAGTITYPDGRVEKGTWINGIKTNINE